MRKKFLLVTAVVTAVAVATPAAAQPSGDTIVTFTVATSNLTGQPRIGVPEPAVDRADG
jgi:hypothetical protein